MVVLLFNVLQLVVLRLMCWYLVVLLFNVLVLVVLLFNVLCLLTVFEFHRERNNCSSPDVTVRLCVCSHLLCVCSL